MSAPKKLYALEVTYWTRIYRKPAKLVEVFYTDGVPWGELKKVKRVQRNKVKNNPVLFVRFKTLIYLLEEPTPKETNLTHGG